MVGAESNSAGVGKGLVFRVVDNATTAQRIKTGEAFCNDVFTELKAMGYDVARNGTEHTHPEFVTSLRRSQDATSLMVRYAPDGVVGFGNPTCSAYVEAKYAKSIERDAYLNYKRLADFGAIVVIVFGQGDTKAFAFAERLKLLPAPDDCRWPVVDGWICPREHPQFWEMKRRGEVRGSGTPHRFVIWDQLTDWVHFDLLLKERMGVVDDDWPF